MSEGPATKVGEVLAWIQGERSTWPESLDHARFAAGEAIEDITPAKLDAMDKAIAAHELALAHWPAWVSVVERTGLDRLDEADQDLLLGTLLERAIQRRKEAGNG